MVFSVLSKQRKLSWHYRNIQDQKRSHRNATGVTENKDVNPKNRELNEELERRTSTEDIEEKLKGDTNVTSEEDIMNIHINFKMRINYLCKTPMLINGLSPQ